MSKFTEEQQAAVDQYKAEVVRLAGAQGYRSEATQILSKADKAFREPHVSDNAAESYLYTLSTSLYNLVSYDRREEARDVLKDAFAAGWDARGSQDAAEGESEQPAPAAEGETEAPKSASFWSTFKS